MNNQREPHVTDVITPVTLECTHILPKAN